jgi:hypothetical protein
MGNQKNIIRTAAAVAAVAAGLFALTLGMADAKGGAAGSGGGGGGGGTATAAPTGGTDTKQNVLLPASCTGGDGFAYAGYNKSGSRATIGFGLQNDIQELDWTVTFDDNGEVFATDAMPYPGTDWSVVENRDSTKGEHVITIHADNGAESCTVSLSYKV